MEEIQKLQNEYDRIVYAKYGLKNADRITFTWNDKSEKISFDFRDMSCETLLEALELRGDRLSYEISKLLKSV